MRPAFKCCEKYFDFITGNRKFLLLLQYMVTLGNFINSNSKRAGAFGIKIKTFTKFNDTKDNKGRPILYTILKLMDE